MSAPDPRNPKVGDEFVEPSTHRGTTGLRTIPWVGRFMATFEMDGQEWSSDLRDIAKHWVPAPEPLITEPLTIADYGNGWWQSAGGFARTKPLPIITILPDHTWIEGSPS